MPVIVSLLRGINVGGHNKIKMDKLRALYTTLGLHDPQSLVQSGNVVFRTEEQNLDKLSKRIQGGIEKSFGCSPDVILRTTSDLRGVVARNPFAKRRGLDPSKLLVTFLPGDPGRDARHAALQIPVNPEEMHAGGRELYIYFPNGIGRSKFPWAKIEKTLNMPGGTGRNWNTVTKLLEMAEKLEASNR